MCAKQRAEVWNQCNRGYGAWGEYGNYRMDQNPHYGELAKTPVYKLRKIINHLQLYGYLNVTNDEYAIVKLTEKAASVLSGEERIEMKMAKEQEHPAKTKTMKKRKGAAFQEHEFTRQEEELFEKLRMLRTEIAKEEKVPPYIVFSDRTLVHMCIVKPETKEEMLTVTGVGEFKYEKYGDRFLDCIKRG